MTWNRGSGGAAVIKATKVVQTAAQAIPDSAATPVQFDAAAVFDDGGLYHPGTSRTNLVIAVAGRYRLAAALDFAGDVSGIRQAAIRVNGADVGHDTQNASTNVAVVASLDATCTMVQLNAGDVVSLFAYQNSGGALNTALARLEVESA